MRHANWSSQRIRIGNQSWPGASVTEKASGRWLHGGGGGWCGIVLRAPRFRLQRSRGRSPFPKRNLGVRHCCGSALSFRRSRAARHGLGVRGRPLPTPPAGSRLLHQQHHLAFARRDPASAHQRPRHGREFQPRRAAWIPSCGAWRVHVAQSHSHADHRGRIGSPRQSVGDGQRRGRTASHCHREPHGVLGFRFRCASFGGDPDRIGGWPLHSSGRHGRPRGCFGVRQATFRRGLGPTQRGGGQRSRTF